jgi:hypothetical protein
MSIGTTANRFRRGLRRPAVGRTMSIICGPSRSDATRLAIVVDIYPWPIPADIAPPSQDGDYWLFFYEDFGVYGRVRCFFAPALF